jgi:SRSO17 transposase
VTSRFYLPKARAADDCTARRRCLKDIEFKTKPEIALDQIRWACGIGLLAGWCCWMPAMATTPGCVHASRNGDYVADI